MAASQDLENTMRPSPRLYTEHRREAQKPERKSTVSTTDNTHQPSNQPATSEQIAEDQPSDFVDELDSDEVPGTSNAWQRIEFTDAEEAILDDIWDERIRAEQERIAKLRQQAQQQNQSGKTSSTNNSAAASSTASIPAE